MLIACPSCHRQYDVAHLEVGEKVRCLCGELATVPEPRTRVARPLHCSSCGGHIEEGASRCAYCGGSISLEERNLGASCPECFARLMKQARYCMGCGVGIDPTAIQAFRSESGCPRCAGTLVHRTVPEGQYTECASCGGLWLEQGFFDRLVDARDLAALGKGLASAKSPASHESHESSGPSETELRYLPCPACGEMMHRKNFGGCSGVIIDWCKPHGFWFDTHELEKIIRFVAAGGLDKARQLELARAEQKLRRTQDLTQKAALHREITFRGGRFDDRAAIEFRFDDAIGVIASGLRRLFGK